jgi:hypothetical protein
LPAFTLHLELVNLSHRVLSRNLHTTN